MSVYKHKQPKQAMKSELVDSLQMYLSRQRLITDTEENWFFTTFATQLANAADHNTHKSWHVIQKFFHQWSQK